MRFARTMALGLITKNGNYSRDYLSRAYPELYKFLMQEITSKRCPLCGKELKTRYAFFSHLRSRCGDDWASLFRNLYGRNRVDERRAIELLNQIRRRNGLQPYYPDRYTLKNTV